MYALFGNKWLNLHGGPVWKSEQTEQLQGEMIELQADVKHVEDVMLIHGMPNGLLGVV